LRIARLIAANSRPVAIVQERGTRHARWDNLGGASSEDYGCCAARCGWQTGISAIQFSGGIFEGLAWFEGATSKGEAWFDEATFKGEAWFTGATFEGLAQFEGASFEGEA
jgi:hypothetical protein